MIAVFHRQWKAYFHSWLFYVCFASFLLSLGVLISIFHVSYQYTAFEYVLSYLTIVLAFLLPILTALAFGEDRERGTMRFVRSLPISAKDMILGKLFSLLAMLCTLSLLLLLVPLLLSSFGSVYFPSAYMGIFGFFLFGFSLVSVYMFFALCFKNRWVFFGVSYGVTGALLSLGYLSSILPEPLGALAERVSLFGTYTPFVFGMVDLHCVVFYLSVGTLFSVLSCLFASRLWKE